MLRFGRNRAPLSTINWNFTQIMASPLKELLAAAAIDPDGIVEPTCEGPKSLCYRTKGEDVRQDGLKTILEQFYCVVVRGDYQGCVKWTEVLENWITLGHCVRRNVRAALVRIYYDMALTPGMDEGPAEAFSSIVFRLAK